MIKIIEEAIDSACGNEGEHRLYPTDNYLAHRILSVIVEAGMLPPTVPAGTPWFKFISDHDGSEITPKLRIDVNQWEPES